MVIVESQDDWEQLDELLDPGVSVLAYMPMIPGLASARNPEERKRAALMSAPFSLIVAQHDAGALDNLREVVQKYPDVIPEILACAHRLRKTDERLFSWAPPVSDQYRDFMSALEKGTD